MLFAEIIATSSVPAGDLNPSVPPGPTMHTLEELYQQGVETHSNVMFLVSPQSWSATTTIMNAGYYPAANLVQVSTNLTANNIKTNIMIFGITGTMSTNTASDFTTKLTKTGQINSYAADDDGALRRGAAWPTPRFVVQANTNCVLDNMTGLIWARNANLFGTTNWSAAINNCNHLTYGEASDWRLPNKNELSSLSDIGTYNPALPAGHPFTGIPAGHACYWTSSDSLPYTGSMWWYVDMYDGVVTYDIGTLKYYAWPVRGGE